MSIEPPRRRLDATRTHEHILIHARTLLAETGVEGFTYAALSRRARVSRMTIMAHWPSRAVLFGELFAESAQELLAGLSGAAPGTATSGRVVAWEFLTALWAGLQVPEVGAPIAVVCGLAETDPAAREAVRGLSADLRAALNSMLTNAGLSLPRREFDTLVGPILAARFFATGPPGNEQPDDDQVGGDQAGDGQAGGELVEFLVDSWWAARADRRRATSRRERRSPMGAVTRLTPVRPAPTA